MSDVDDARVHEAGHALVKGVALAAILSIALVAGLLWLRSPSRTASDEPRPHAPATIDGQTTPVPRTPEAELEASYRRLLAEDGWKAASPGKNAAGLWRAVHEKTGLTFVLIPAGSFKMGSPEHEAGRDDDEPLRMVSIRKPFLFSETECTQDAWDRVGGEDRRRFKGAELPIDGVSWNDARQWCKKAGLRLPTEAEWEYASRAGTDTRYSFGDDEDRLHKHGWYLENSRDRTQEVATLKPNSWGLYDMHGNVREWCEDVYLEDHAGAPRDGSASLSGPSSNRVLRGGGFSGRAQWNRSASRVRFDPDLRHPDASFRPARDAP
jgi:formylglycine-generating enzyme required for sulfatase activity